MAKTALIILAPGFEEIEAITAIDILRRAGVRVTIAGIDSLTVNGSRSITVRADCLLEDNTVTDYNAYVLPGGMPGAVNLINSEKVKDILKKSAMEKKVIAAICAAPAVVLAPLGILDNKIATCYPGMQTGFNQSISYKPEKVVVDGNIITGSGPAAALEFSLAIVKALAGQEITEKLRKAVLLTPDEKQTQNP